MTTTITVDGVKIELTETMKELSKQGKEIRRRARIRLKARDKVVSGKLYDSIQYEQGINKKETEAFLRFTFKGAEYWNFVDQGVRGAISSAKAPQSPFQYGSGKGPKGLRGAIDKWVVRKPVGQVRNAQGQFIPRKSLVFLISRSIYQTGIKPSNFFSTPYDEVRKKRADKLSLALGSDIAESIVQQLQEEIDGRNN